MAGKRDPSSHRTPEQIRKKNAGYDARPENVAKRVKNNQARAELKKEGVALAGKDVDHIKPLRSGGGNARSNLRALDKSKNRAWRAKD